MKLSISPCSPRAQQIARSLVLSSLSALLIASGASCGPDRDIPVVPPDRSLSSWEYMMEGLPDPSVRWTREDREAAHRVLWALQNEDPTLLPRAGSPKSSVVFEKLVSEHTSNVLEILGPYGVQELLEKDAAQLSDLFLDRSLIGVYSPRLRPELIFDHELVAIQVAALDGLIEGLVDFPESQRRLAEALERIEKAGGTAPEIPELEIAPASMLLPLFAQLATIVSAEGFSPEAREVGLSHLKRLAAQSSHLLLPDQQQALQRLVIDLREAHM